MERRQVFDLPPLEVRVLEGGQYAPRKSRIVGSIGRAARPRDPRPAIGWPTRQWRWRSSRGLWSGRRGVELVQGLDDEAVAGQDADPVAVAGMELGPAAGPSHAVQPSLRSHQALCREPFLLRHAQCGQHAVGEEHQPAARAQQPRRLRDPPLGIAPHARPVLAHTRSNDASAAARPAHRPRSGGTPARSVVGNGPRCPAAPGQVNTDGPRAPPGQPGGQVRGSAAELDDVKPGDIAEDAHVALGHMEQTPRDIVGGPSPRRVLVAERRVH